jgi:endonuclease YncB( thermonuclease family)
MKKLTVFLSALVLGFSSVAYAQKPANGVSYDVQFTRVIDGDTVAFKASFLPAPLKQELALRVYGVDTPEKGHRAKCASEDARGKAATKFTTDAINATKSHKIVLMDWDKYGGRVLGDIVLDGQSLRTLLIQNGYAREYYGEAKTSWCN